MKKKATINIIRYILLLSFTLALIYFTFKYVKWVDLWEGIQQANYFWVGMSILIGIASYLIRALRWQILIEPLGFKPSTSSVYNAIMVGYLTNLAIPRMGEVSRCAMLTKTNNVPFDSLIGTVVLERIFDLLFLLLAVAVVILVRIDFFGAFIFNNVLSPLSTSISGIFSSGSIVLLTTLFIAIACCLVYFFRDRLKKLGMVTKVKVLLKGFLEGIKSGIKMKRKLAFICYSALIMLCYWMMSYTMMFAIPETANLTIADALFLFVLGGLGWAVPVQGGFGAFHLIVASGLTLYGISFEKGIIFATISHEAQVLFMIILGFVSLWSIFFKPNTKTVLKL